MNSGPKAIRVAIVLNGQEFVCLPATLPFSLEGYPPLDLVLYGATPETSQALQVFPIKDLRPDEFDLILDGQSLTAGLPEFSPERTRQLISGPLANFLKGLVCQLQELRQKQ